LSFVNRAAGGLDRIGYRRKSSDEMGTAECQGVSKARSILDVQVPVEL